jgi:hypothetical protein
MTDALKRAAVADAASEEAEALASGCAQAVGLAQIQLSLLGSDRKRMPVVLGHKYSEAIILTARSASARSGTVVSSPNP